MVDTKADNLFAASILFGPPRFNDQIVKKGPHPCITSSLAPSVAPLNIQLTIHEPHYPVSHFTPPVLDDMRNAPQSRAKVSTPGRR